MIRKHLLSVLIGFLLTSQAQADLTLFTDRPTARLQPVAQKFESLTGHKITIVEAGYDQLIEKLKTEHADMLFVKDLVLLEDASQKGLFQPMTASPALSRVAPFMQSSKKLWTAVTYRVRTLAYDPSRVDVSQIKSYEDLTADEWAGRLCLRTSKGGYNEALTGFLIAELGLEKTRQTLKGWLDNLATEVFPNDTSLLNALASGTCDVGLVNHYYLAQLVAQNPNFPVKIHFLNQNNKGTHSNGSGIGVLKQAQDKAAAQAFIELLLSDEYQLQISSAHFDYPAVQTLAPASLIREWGGFKKSETPWEVIGQKIPQAKELFKELGYN